MTEYPATGNADPATRNRSKSGHAIRYPQPAMTSQSDDYHGERIRDPYRGLEDADDPLTVAWYTAQNELTRGVLDAVPGRDAISSRLTELWDYPRYGVPFERGGRWFQTRNSGLQGQPVLEVSDTAAWPAGGGRVLIDPNLLSADGTAAVAAISVSPDGSLVAYAISQSGSDWMTWQVRDVASGADLGEELKWSKSATAAWRGDSSGFYYAATTPPQPGSGGNTGDTEKRVLFHRAGTQQRDDELVFAPGRAAVFPAIEVSTDGAHLILSLSRGIGPGAELRVRELDGPAADWQVLVPAGDAYAKVAAGLGGTFYLLTDAGADRRRIVAVDAARPAEQHWREVVPQAAQTLLQAHLFGGRLVCHYLRDACSLLRVFELDGSFVRDIPMPELSTLAGSPVEHEMIEGRPGSDLLHFEAVSFTRSASLWSHDLRTGQTALVRAAAVTLAAADYVTERASVTSADGTIVPVFLTRRRDLPRDGEAPVLLHGYGGVGVSVTPSFSPAWAAWLERGGLLAVASLRGGGEFGRRWHEDGRRQHKQNVFDDLCACARWLAASGWSRAARIGINGGSNGGLLVTACLTQHPELFGAVIADAALTDMLRFPRFTVAWLWMTEYGNPADPVEYRWLRGYSPLHHIRPACYPATMLATGDHDDRVVPGHSFKLCAALQQAQQGSAPVLLRVDTDAGHGGQKKPTAKAIAEAADKLAFLERALKFP